jgi:hypothetical protein
MTTKVTRNVLEGYLRCKTEAHLKLSGLQGSASEYETLLVASRDEDAAKGHRQDPRASS